MYSKLKIWEMAMEVAEIAYAATSLFPEEERYGLSSQIRRSAVSIPSNIAEGKGRQTDREFKQFLYIARGSLFEMRTQLELSRRLGYLKNPNDLKAKIKELKSMLNSLISKL